MEGTFLFVDEDLLRKIINEEVTNVLTQLLESVKSKQKRLYTRFDIMDMFDISPKTVDNLLKHGDLHAFKFGGKLFFDSEELDRDIENFRYHKFKHKSVE